MIKAAIPDAVTIRDLQATATTTPRCDSNPSVQVAFSSTRSSTSRSRDDGRVHALALQTGYRSQPTDGSGAIMTEKPHARCIARSRRTSTTADLRSCSSICCFLITQISHTLLAHFTPLGTAGHAVASCGGWKPPITNWLDPEQTPSAAGCDDAWRMVLSTSIPTASTARIGFAIAMRRCRSARRFFVSRPAAALRHR